MDGSRIFDRVALANGIVGRTMGASTDAFRPSGAERPLSLGNRFLRLPALFTAANGAIQRNTSYGIAIYDGYFDMSYTRPGDYLEQGARTWFIANQEALGPAHCVLTNRVVTIDRPESSVSMGSNPYGGAQPGPATHLAVAWPASILAVGRDGFPASGLPTDVAMTSSTILLPVTVANIMRPTDIAIDDLGRTHVITSCEITHLGWRLIARLVTN